MRALVVERDVVLRAGQKNRVVGVAFERPPRVARPAPAPGPAPRKEASASPRVLPWVALGAGVLVYGAGAAFWIDAESTRRELASTCAPACDRGAVDSIERSRLVGAVLVGVGVAVVAAGIVGYLVGSDHSSPPPPSSSAAPRARARAPLSWTF